MFHGYVTSTLIFIRPCCILGECPEPNNRPR